MSQKTQPKYIQEKDDTLGLTQLLIENWINFKAISFGEKEELV